MSTQTTNLGLTKPAGNERPRINPINGNMDILDAVIGDVDIAQDGSLQSQINAIITAISSLGTVMDYKGSVADMAALNAITGQKTGNVYNVTSTGENYAWAGSFWDLLGNVVDLTGYATQTYVDNAIDAALEVIANGSY